MAQGLYDIKPLEAWIQQGYTVLTPNFRLARRIKIEWDAQRLAAGDKVWKPLSVKPLEHWLLEQWDLAVSLELLPHCMPLEQPQVLELWRQVISEQISRGADYPLVRTEAIAEIAAQARELLLRWHIDTNAPSLQQLFSFERDCHTFLQWLRVFEQRLAGSGLCTPADCLVQLTQLTHALPGARVVLVEFEQITPLLRAALNAVSPPWQDIKPLKTSAARVAYAFSGKRAELQALAAWVAQNTRDNPAQTIGVVLDDAGGDCAALEYLLRREFDCLGENYSSLPVNFSSGTPLIHAPLVRAAVGALASVLPEIAVPDMLYLLNCRFLCGVDSQASSTQQAIKRLYALGRDTVSLADVCTPGDSPTRAGAGNTLEQRLRTLMRMPVLKRKVLPSAWPGHFAAILSLWGWPGALALDSVEYQQFEQWSRVLDEFAAFDVVCGPISVARAVTLLRDCCSRHIFHPQTADYPIQVLGPLEAAGLAFDQLWVCGMQATSWPAPPRPNPFIPLAVQTQFGMPHATSEGELAFSTSLLEQYAHNCRILHASYCRQLDGVTEIPSALLRGFAIQPIVEPDPIAVRWSEMYDAAQMSTVSDFSGPSLFCEAGTVLAGGSSVLEDQSQCAFRSFARHRLQVDPLPGFWTALSPGERGSLLHAALAALWRELGDSTSLVTYDAATEQRVVESAIATAIASLPAAKQQRLGNTFWSLESQRLAILLREWLAVERQRGPFTVIATERDTLLELGKFRLQLRIDRIDQLPDGSQLLIDYKSGRGNVRDWLGERPPKPQLPLYAQAQPEAVSALAFAQVRPRQCCYTGLGKIGAAPGITTDIPLPMQTDSLEQDWAVLNQSWRDVLERLAAEYVAGDAYVDPYKPEVCARCGLQPLCRVNAAPVGVEADVE